MNDLLNTIMTLVILAIASLSYFVQRRRRRADELLDVQSESNELQSEVYESNGIDSPQLIRTETQSISVHVAAAIPDGTKRVVVVPRWSIHPIDLDDFPIDISPGLMVSYVPVNQPAFPSPARPANPVDSRHPRVEPPLEAFDPTDAFFVDATFDDLENFWTGVVERIGEKNRRALLESAQRDFGTLKRFREVYEQAIASGLLPGNPHEIAKTDFPVTHGHANANAGIDPSPTGVERIVPDAIPTTTFQIHETN